MSRTAVQRQFATQAMLYCAVFAMTWFFATVNHIMTEVAPPGYIPLAFLHSIFGTLQGFFNALIYIRPRYIRYREQQQARKARLQQHHQEQERQRRLAKQQDAGRHQHDESKVIASDAEKISSIQASNSTTVAASPSPGKFSRCEAFCRAVVPSHNNIDNSDEQLGGEQLLQGQE